MISVPLDAGTMVLGSSGGHCSVRGGSGHCFLTNWRPWVKQSGRRVKLMAWSAVGWLSLGLVVVYRMSCISLLAAPFVFLQIPLFLTSLESRKSTWRKIGASLRHGTRPAGGRCRPRKGKEEIGDGHATSSLAADAASSTSGRFERAESGVGKKSKMQHKYLNVTSDDFWCVRPGRKAAWARRTTQIKKLTTRSTNWTSRRRSMCRLWHYYMQILKGYVRRRGRPWSNVTGTSTSPWECSPKAVLVAFELRKRARELKKIKMKVWELSATISKKRPQRLWPWPAARTIGVTTRSSTLSKPWPWWTLCWPGIRTTTASRWSWQRGRRRNEWGLNLCDSSVRQGELSLDEQVEMDRLYSMLYLGLLWWDRISDSESKRFVSCRVNSSHQEALLYVFEDNEAVIKMIRKGGSPTVRHVSRTHRVSFAWWFNRINLDPKIHIKYIDTKKGKFHTWWIESSFVFVQH